jgi:hypothetical protein
VNDGAKLYYLSNAGWSGTLRLMENAVFQQIEAFFTSINAASGLLIGKFDAAPDLLFEVLGTDDPVAGTYQLVTGFVGTATTEWFTDDTAGSNSNRVFLLRVTP